MTALPHRPSLLRAAGVTMATAFMLLAACQAGRPSVPASGDASAYLSAQLSELDAMPAPDGVDAEDWQQLKAGLAAMLQPGRAVLAAPVTVPSAAKLSLDDNALLLNWGYACQGDYDQNSEVNIADLAPLGTNFQEKSNGGTFPAGSLLSMIDGDNNGELNIADLSPIGTNFGRRVKAFNVYRTLNLTDLPATSGGPVGAGAELLGSVAYEQFSGNRTIEQLRYSFQLAQAAPGWFYFVRPADGASEGTPSNVVSFGAKPGNLDPLAELLASPQSGNLPLSVSFDASGSSDPDGAAGNINDIILFSWDFDGDGVVDQSTAGPSTSHDYLAAGNFTASVTVFDEEAGSGKASVAISVTGPGNQNPVASFSADPQGGGIPLLVSFDASGSTDPDGNITSFAWDFNGDGLTDFVGGTPSAQFNYTTAGSFDVRLTVLDDKSASDSTVLTIDAIDTTVNQPPTAVLSIEQPTGEAPQLVTLDGQVAAPTADARFGWR